MNSVASSRAVDPSIFNDPLAMKVGWMPIKKGGTNFRTHKVVQIDANRIELQPSTFMRLLPFSVIAFPIIIGGIVFYQSPRNGMPEVNLKLFLTALPIVIFVIVAMIFLLRGSKIPIFDKNYGYYWKGRKSKPGVIVIPSEKKDAIQLSQIHALQIVSEMVISNSGKSTTRYRSYEVNMVLTSGERMNIMDHSNEARLFEDANTISQFLGIPIWNGA